MKPNIKRLSKLADILDAADAQHRKHGEPRYSQERFAHHCGTPACALGHWAAAHPRRWHFVHVGAQLFPHLRKESQDAALFDARTEFGLSHIEVDDLFSAVGCDGATTSKQAARHIRKFIKRKERESSHDAASKE